LLLLAFHLEDAILVASLLGSGYRWQGVFDQTGLLLLALLHLQDVFSLGCVIAELWLDGRAFFDLSRLLAYRRGEYDPVQALAGVAPDIAELIMHMIQRAPGAVCAVVMVPLDRARHFCR
jgi:hypothetical protein